MSAAPRTAVCTICSANYLAQARTLMASLAEHEPEWERQLLLVDRVDGRFDPADEDFEILEVEELALPEQQRFLFRYTLLELNTAVKPYYLRRLFEQGFERVIYIDPDIQLFQPLAEVHEALDDGALMVLTPHLTAPLRDDKRPTEIDILKAGAYNLGFIGLARHPQLEDFLAWWMTKTERDCVVDFQAGLFVDQRWIDLVPGLFADVRVLRHEGYNVAYWNLAERALAERDGAVYANEDLLVFYHFSGLDAAAPHRFSKHQNRFTYDQLPRALRGLVLGYCEEVKKRGLEKCRTWGYAFGRFPDGAAIADPVRVLYREHAAIRRDGGEDPFELGIDYFNQQQSKLERPLVTRVMVYCWESRPDLQRFYPDPQGVGAFDFAYWFVEKIADEFDLPPAYVEPVRASLVDPSNEVLREPLRWRVGRRLRPMGRRLPVSLKEPLKRLLLPAPPVDVVQELTAEAMPPARTSFDSLPTGIDYAGFHAMDDHDRDVGGALMGKIGRLRLGAETGRTLCLRGHYDAHLHRTVVGRGGLALSILLDGERVGELLIKQHGDFEEQLELDEPARAGAELVIEAERVVTPSQAGLGDDGREISIRVASVRFDDVVVLDFGHDVPYRVRRSGAGRNIGYTIVGYVHSELGIGESARLGARAAQAAGLALNVADFSHGSSNRADDGTLSDHVTNQPLHPVNVIHVNADQLPAVWAHFGEAFFRDRYNVGVWHWELPEFPDEWRGSFELLDELWAPSRFVMDTLAEKSPIPVVYMPHAIDFLRPKNPRRRDFGLPEQGFLFLAMYDMHSFQERKNPRGALEAFRRAFPDGGAGLVVKVMNGDSRPEDLKQLKQEAAEIEGVYVLEGTLSRAEVFALEAVCDAFVSLHRAEGFGLGIAESMFLGKPVVATNWSGNVDFMNERNACPVDFELREIEEGFGPYRRGQVWAEPDLDHASTLMRKLAGDADYCMRIGARAQASIVQHHAPAVIGERQKRRLRIIAERL